MGERPFVLALVCHDSKHGYLFFIIAALLQHSSDSHRFGVFASEYETCYVDHRESLGYPHTNNKADSGPINDRFEYGMGWVMINAEIHISNVLCRKTSGTRGRPR